MSDDVLIRISGIGKSYSIRHQPGKARGRQTYQRFSEVLANWASHPGRYLAQGIGRKPAMSNSTAEEFWALKDVSFDVRRGEVVGVIGRNGAGKSTLLKILSRITEPTTGRVEIDGRVASLLEVGTGFHPELTGRENIYLNGAILGMTRVEVKRKFDEIVAFAEVEHFLDTPVKRYSSGMYVRLGFAVAAHMEPEILIVDEVLAVGDIAFQAKCIGKMGDVAKQGRTVLVVSHNMASIRALCGRCTLLEGGRLIYDGDTAKTVALYMGSGVAQEQGEIDLTEHPRRLSGMANVLKRIRLYDADGQTVSAIHQDEDLYISIEYQQAKDPLPSHMGFVLYTQEGVRVSGFNTAMAHSLADWRVPAVGGVTFKIPRNSLNPGQFVVTPSISTLPNTLLDKVENAISFGVQQADIYRTGYILTTQDGIFPLRCTIEARSGKKNA